MAEETTVTSQLEEKKKKLATYIMEKLTDITM